MSQDPITDQLDRAQPDGDLATRVANLERELAQLRLLRGARLFRSSIIPGEDSTSSASYTTLATPDRISALNLPAGGLIIVWFQAVWTEDYAGEARAALFLGENQAKVATWDIAGNAVTTAAANHGDPTPGTPTLLLSHPGVGLIASTSNNDYYGDLTSGQLIGLCSVTAVTMWAFEHHGTVIRQNLLAAGGPAGIFADPGAYDVSVRFKVATGSVRAKQRRLYVATIA